MVGGMDHCSVLDDESLVSGDEIEETGPYEEEDISLTQPANSIIFTSFEQVLLWCGIFSFMSYATYKPIVSCIRNESEPGNHSTHTSVLVLDKEHNALFCKLYQNGSCQMLTWEAPFGTIIEEWALICDKDWIPQTINSFQMAGTVVAMIVSGMCADFFGRKRIFMITFVALFVANVASTLVTDPMHFAVMRFIVGGLSSASSVTNFVWGMELTDQRHNVIVNLAQLWHFAFMGSAGLAYIFDDWRSYTWSILVICSPLLILYHFYGESPVWLVQKGHLLIFSFMLETCKKFVGKSY